MTKADNASSAGFRVQVVQVLTRHQMMITSYAYAMTGDHHLAEDVYQEVATIVAQRDELPPGEEVIPWLREITRRKALELRRRSRRVGMLLSSEVLEVMAPHFEEDDGTSGAAELRSAMAQCVDKLGSEQRTVVEGRYASGLSCEDIADQVGRSVQGVYSMLKRLRAILARCVQQNLGRSVSER